MIEKGNPLKLLVTEELNKKRQYERLDFEFLSNSKDISTAISSNGYYIDKQGNKYKIEEYFFRKNELEQPRLFLTDHTVEIDSDENEPIELKGIKINGYLVTEFINETIDITVE